MNYVEVNCNIIPAGEFREIIIALLAEQGFEMFEETTAGAKAYIREQDFDESILHHLKNSGLNCSLDWTVNKIPDINWNHVWESNFKPVRIGDQVLIRAEYHQADSDMKYEIIIQPKMSFGTGHHATTQLMIETMLELDFSQKRVLDMGCGSGILAIMAEMLGAAHVDAVEIEEHAVENARENSVRNRCQRISVLPGDATLPELHDYDIILANINRNIIVEDLKRYSELLNSSGIAVLSGFYENDLKIISAEAFRSGMKLISHAAKSDWCVARFEKQV